jgi:hypothetical protein
MSNGSRAGVDRIRTHTNRRMSDHNRPHEMYMRLTSLEIERSRRVAERDATRDRLNVVEERISAIEQERDALLCQLAKLTEADESQAVSGPGPAPRTPFSY